MDQPSRRDQVLEWCASWFDDRGHAPTVTYRGIEEWLLVPLISGVIVLAIGALAFWGLWVLFPM